MAAEDRLDREDFHKVRDFIYRKTGMFFEDGKHAFVEKRVLDRMRATGEESFRSWFQRLRFEIGGQEKQRFINALTVNETYFLREDYQLTALVESILPEIVQRKSHSKRLRILSMPCSTGEEPYSLAITLLERWDRADEWDIEIVGTDIDTRVLEDARAGVYGRRSLQNVPRPWLERYFSHVGEDRFAIAGDLRSSIDFHHVNLNDPQEMQGLGTFDVIFCRNLLIYFDDLSRRRAAETLFDTLEPLGFLCLGHSESMSRISSIFKVRKFPEAIVYQKPFV